MATINQDGNAIGRCIVCHGAKSVFTYARNGTVLGVVTIRQNERDYYGGTRPYDVQFRLFTCSGCGMGALGAIKMTEPGGKYPADIRELIWFLPEAKERLDLPAAVPDGITKEFREAERCLEANCFRASAALFRSVLDKTLRHNGYKVSRENLKEQIDAAAVDGIVTQSRQRRAHEDIRVLGNDVLHEEWRPVTEEEVQLAHHYVQRILEDFYDDRESVLAQLTKAGRAVREPTPATPPNGA